MAKDPTEARRTRQAAANDLPLPLRLHASLHLWTFASPMVQKIISRGLTWKWSNKPPALSLPPHSTCKGNLTPHISRMLAEGVIAELPLQPCYCAHLFLVPKSSGGDRVVINLSSLNLRIACPTFKMQTVAKVRNSIPSGALFTSIDLSDAFHHIPIHPRFQKYLAFTHEGKLFFFKAMPFGINIGPRIFSLVVTEALKLLHKKGISASVYIDDWLLWNKSYSTLTSNTSQTVDLLRKLGFTINLEKSQLIPTPTITYLGIVWSGTPHTLLPSNKSIENVISLAQESLQLPMLSRKRYQILLGSINFVAPYIKQGLLHLRQIILTAPNFKSCPSRRPSDLFLQHLQWWTHRENLEAPIPMSIPPPHMTVWTDASKTGWGGGILKQHHGQGPLDPRRSTPPHQLPGVSGSHPFPSGSLPSTELRDHDQVRQHGSGLPDQQAGVQQKQEPVPSPTGPPLPLQPSLLDPQSPSSAGSPECLGRLPIPQPSNQSGMVPLSSQFPKANSKSSGTADRPLRTSRERETSDLRLPLPVPNSDGRGCPNSGLEPVGEDLPLSPSRPPPNLPTETSSLRRHGPHRRTLPSLRPLVARVPRGLHPTRRRLRGRTMGTRRVAAGTRNDILSLSRIQFLQRIYALKYDASVAEALSSALRQSTRSQYEHSWKDFQRWLAAHPNKPITKATILLYLTQLAHSKELSPKTILVYRNSLKLPLLYGFSINTSDREFSLLARSQFLANPPPKKIIPAWNPNKVLSMFEQPQFSNSRATPSRLLMKTLFLVALASGNRVSEIAAFSRAGSKILPGSKKATLAVHPGFLYKNQTMDRTPPNIIINALLNPDKSPHRLCPVDALHHWLRLSEPWGEDAVFINPKTRKKMNRGAVSLLLVTAINQANPRVFAKAHDVRKISATLAWTRGVPPHQIVQTMFWKSTTVFIKKYLVPIHSGSPP